MVVAKPSRGAALFVERDFSAAFLKLTFKKISPSYLEAQKSCSLESPMQKQPLPTNVARNHKGCPHQPGTHQDLVVWFST